MYCQDCGTKLIDNSKFCNECGSAVNSQKKTDGGNNNQAGILGATTSQSYTHNITTSNDIYRKISIIIAAILSLLMFTKWFKIPLLSIASELLGNKVDIPSDFAIYSLITNFTKITSSDLVDKEIIILFILFNIIIWIAILVFLVRYIINMLNPEKQKNTDTFNYALIMIIILVVIDVFCMLGINAMANDESIPGININVMKLNNVAYFVLLIAIVSKFFLIGRVNDELYYAKKKNTDIQEMHTKESFNTNAKQGIWVCKKCGTINKFSHMTCKDCGTYK